MIGNVKTTFSVQDKFKEDKKVKKEFRDFSTIIGAVKQLEEYGKKFHYKRIMLENKEIARRCVSSSIYRSFRNYPKNNSPSVIFRNWAEENIEKLKLEIEKSNKQVDYDSIIKAYGKALIKDWKNKSNGKKIGYGPALKMLNLLIKKMHEGEKIDTKYEKYFNVPIDSYILVPLAPIIDDLSNCLYSINITKNATMGMISCEEIYDQVQIVLRKIAEKAKISPIIIDYYCWDEVSANGKKKKIGKEKDF